MEIIQFSPIRSGSTIVYNIIKELTLNNIKVSKEHTLFKINENILYIITIRHPYNSIISYLMAFKKDINDDNLIDAIDIYLNNGGKSLLNINVENENILILYYIKFINNHKYIYDILIEKLKLKNTINNIDYNKFKIENIIKIISKFETFHEYDKETHFHGCHISKYKGETDYKKILNETQIKILNNNKILNEIILKFNIE